jgi:hypothetical protein
MRPAETEMMTDSNWTPAMRSARSTAWLMAFSVSVRSTTAPAFMPRATVCEMPLMAMPWVRRRSTSCGACGLSLATRQAILLVPTSSAATTAVRLAETGFIFGVIP